MGEFHIPHQQNGRSEMSIMENLKTCFGLFGTPSNKDYINSYKGEERIISDYYRFKDGNGNKIELDGIITPLKVDNRQLMAPVDNQLNSPHCAGFSAATLVESIYWKHTGRLLQLDSHQVYALAKQLDGQLDCDGTYLEQALKSVLKLCGKDERFSFLKNAKIGLVYNDGTQNTVNAVKRLVHEYDFIQSGFSIDNGWYNCNNRNYILKKGYQNLGGHAVNICGYDSQGFYIMNQWGTDWGSKGFAIMPYDLFMKQFMYCGYIDNMAF